MRNQPRPNMTDKEKIKILVDAINKVQNKIILFQSNSSAIFDPVKDAWNINAAALNTCWKEQSDYLREAGLLR